MSHAFRPHFIAIHSFTTCYLHLAPSFESPEFFIFTSPTSKSTKATATSTNIKATATATTTNLHRSSHRKVVDLKIPFLLFSVLCRSSCPCRRFHNIRKPFPCCLLHSFLTRGGRPRPRYRSKIRHHHGPQQPQQPHQRQQQLHGSGKEVSGGRSHRYVESDCSPHPARGGLTEMTTSRRC